MENNYNNQPQKTQTHHFKAPKKSKQRSLPQFEFNKQIMFNMLSIFLSGLLGGIAFALGSTAFLSLSNKMVGSAIFTVGMFIIFAYGFGFYTSKIGYSLKKTMEQNLNLIPIWFGNIIGAILTGGLLMLTREDVSNMLYSRANQICIAKINDNPFSIIILSVFCGILMFVVTDNFKNAKNAAQKYLSLFLGSMVFLLCGFEHFVSNAFFFTVSGALSLKAIWYLILMTLGNSLGALVIPLSHIGVKYFQKMSNK